MQITTSDHFIHLHSPYFAMAFARHWAWLAHLGVESGGRLQRHREGNLLKPGLGGCAVHDDRDSRRQTAVSTHGDDHVSYTCADGLDWDICFADERTCTIRLTHRGGRIRGTFWRLACAPAVSPPSIWGNPIAEPAWPPSETGTEILDPPQPELVFSGPLLIHFPDHGHLRLTGRGKNLVVRETLRPDLHMTGLNLGCSNTGYHTACVAQHHGTVELEFVAHDDNDAIEIEFYVVPEIHPQIPGIDLSGRQWDGLRRNWLSAFALNPQTLTMGDNLVLSGVAHLAMHYKSDQAVFTPALLPGVDVHRYLGRALRFTFRDCVTPHGMVHAAWAHPERRDQLNFDFFEGGISAMIALRNHIAVTGDWSIARDCVDNLIRAGNFLLGLDSDHDGILEMPFPGIAMTADRSYRNWWDNFPFGHKDAWVNLLAYRALGDLAEILHHLAKHDEATVMTKWRTRFAAVFDRTFFNPITGVYAGWIDSAGHVHDHLFTCISAMAVNHGVVPAAKAKAVMSTLLQRLRAEGYGSWTWGIPGPLMPVSEADGHIWEPMQRWGSYENGGMCGMTAQHFISALYCVGLRDDADAILFTMLGTFEREATHSGLFPGYMKSADWRTKEGLPCGYNFLADNYHFMLSGITGHHSVKPPVLPS